uniref:Centromere protein J n=1 Tax=Cyclopterus lumpus TaxID=8103 RepID=A0A8C3G912_CYCLU
MSSQAGLRCSQADFLARWMPGSTRAGVILGPVPDPTQGSPSLGPDDSFASDFAPLPGSSVDSSYLGVDGLARSPGGETAEREGPQSGLSSGVPRGSDGELEEMEGLPIRVKLEQLRKWQQHMQEQLKAHQLEELLRLQEEQQKLLGMMNGSPHGSEGTLREPLLPGNSRSESITRVAPIPNTKDQNSHYTHCVSLQQSHAPPKRAFLKRGEGLSRFTTGRKVSLPKSWVRKDPKDPEPQLQARVVSGPAALQRGVQRVGVQRKTATLNKENRPGGLSSPQDVRMSKAARMKVLGSHQRQNTEAPESIQSDPQEGKPPRNLKEGPERAARPAAGESGIRRWHCDRQLETVELGEFELLEQAAEELSFSSNSSFVMKQHRGLHPRRLSSTPIKSPPGSGAGSAGKISSVPPDAFVVKMSGDEDSEGSTCGAAELEEREAALEPPSFPTQPDPPYDKQSYQDEESSGDDASTLNEDAVVFDDDDTWNELDGAGSANDSRGVSPAGAARTLSRKVSRAVQLDEDAPPPASQLMTRLFPSLNPKAQNAPLHPAPAVARCPPPGQQLQSRQLRERLVELEIEIQRFKKENAALSKLRHENEEQQELLRKERLVFERTRAEELAELEEHKREENRKLQKERKLFEKHATAARAIPDKKEREEIQVLKQQLSSLQEELRGRESRWASSHSRLRQQMDSLGQENGALRDQVPIRMLEKLRLSTWRKTPVEAEKDREAKDPRTCEGNATKGVKFAVSMFILLSQCQGTLLASGERLVVFNNGTRKEVSADGQTVKVTFFNGDTKEVTADQRVIYFYADAQTTHITFPDGVEVLHFPNNQTEKHFPDGRKEIVFPDQTVKNLFPGGREESVLTDGTVIQVSPDGTKQILFNTGQKEVHTAGYKRREYPDGTVKTVYADGRQETRYPNGRLRVKDRDGNVVLDSGA